MTGAATPSQAPALRVLHRDDRFAVVDKPAGMAVHRTRSSAAPTVEDLFATLGGPSRDGPFLAHRLDRDTSGCLVIALRRSALRAAQACFAAGTVRKVYWALTDGVPAASSGTVRSRLGRVERGRRWRMEETADGRPAETAWRVLGTDGASGWLELRPHTGRTHQIRVHCAALGCPLIGDAVYGRGGTAPFALHGRAITLPLDPAIAAVAPAPAAFDRWRPFENPDDRMPRVPPAAGLQGRRP